MTIKLSKQVNGQGEFHLGWKRKSPGGFTMVEVMISMAILTSITVMTWAAVSSMFASKDLLTARAERYQEVRVTMDRIGEDLAAAYVAGPAFGGDEIPGEALVRSTDADSDKDPLQNLLEEPIEYGFIARSEEINFTSFSHLRTQQNEKASRHSEIGYFIRDVRDEDTGDLVKRLMRREDTTPDNSLENGGSIFTLLEGIEKFELKYWDAGPTRLGTAEEVAEGRWVDSWDTTRRDNSGRLPTRIKIRLELPPQPPNTRNEIFVTQVQLATTEILEF